MAVPSRASRTHGLAAVQRHESSSVAPEASGSVHSRESRRLERQRLSRVYRRPKSTIRTGGDR